MNGPNLSAQELQKIDEEITAYLDGELSGESLRELEQRLASDPIFRQRLAALDRSWMLLDELPKFEVGQQFAATTVEMVAHFAENSTQVKNDGWTGQLIQQWAFIAFAVLAACLIGFILATSLAAILSATGFLTTRNDDLLEDLPVLVNLDKYQLVDDIEFLRGVSGLPYFSKMAMSATEKSPQPGDRLAARRMRIDRMEAAEKKRLLTSQEMFEGLDFESQAQLRDFHRQLVQDPDSDRLIRGLDDYYSWYKQLDPQEHVKLRILPANERISYITKLSAQQQPKQSVQSTSQEFRAVVHWLQNVVLQNQERLLRNTTKEERRDFEKLSDKQKRARLMLFLWKHWRQEDDLRKITIDDHEYLAMKEQLPPSIRQKLSKQPTRAAEILFLLNISRNAYRKTLSAATKQKSNFPFLQKDKHSVPRPSAERRPNRDQLDTYFKNLPQRKRAQLKRLSPEEFRRELRRRYNYDQIKRPDRRSPRDPPQIRPTVPRGAEFNRKNGGNRRTDLEGPPQGRKPSPNNSPPSGT